MAYRTSPRRRLPVSFSPLSLVASIALGIWLGFVLLALTAWLGARLLPGQVLAPLAEVTRPLHPAPAPVPSPAPTSADSTQMFEQYQQNLARNAEQQRLEQARNSQRNLSNPKCQFWLQQDQTAPSDKSRANVLQFCN